MATIAPDQNQLNQQQQNAGGGGQVINSTGGGGATGVASGSQGSTGAYSPARAPLSGQPNIEQYLQANQGAGQQLSQGIQNNFQTQNQALNNQLGSYNNQLSSQYNPISQNLNNAQNTTQTAFQNPQALLDAYNQSKTQSSNQPLQQNNNQYQSMGPESLGYSQITGGYGPGSVDAHPQQNPLDQYNQFQQLATGGYNQNIADYGNAATQYGYNLQNQLGGLQQQAQAANTEMGRSQLLQGLNQPGYNMGERSLDTLFLGGSPGVANQLKQNLGGMANQSAQSVNAFNNQNQQQAASLQGLSDQAKASIQNLFMNGNADNTGLNQISSNVGNEVQSALAAQPGVLQGFQQSAQAGPAYTAAGSTTPTNLGQFTSAQLQQLGLSPDLNAWGVNLGKYMSSTPLANLSTQGQNTAIANPEEFARYNALNQLLGGAQGTGTAQQSIFGTNTKQADTPYNPMTFDKTGFQNAVDQQKAALTGADWTNEINQSFLPAATAHFYGDQSSNVSNNIAAALKAGVSPDQLYNQLNNSGYRSALGNSLSSQVSANGLNAGFTDMGNQAYGNALSGLKNWLTKTYNPAAYDFLGDNAAANSAQNPLMTTPTLGTGQHGPQITKPTPTLPIDDNGYNYDFTMPGTTPASMKPSFGGF